MRRFERTEMYSYSFFFSFFSIKCFSLSVKNHYSVLNLIINTLLAYWDVSLLQRLRFLLHATLILWTFENVWVNGQHLTANRAETFHVNNSREYFYYCKIKACKLMIIKYTFKDIIMFIWLEHNKTQKLSMIIILLES